VTANITAVTITCSTNTFSIGGTVSGLGNSKQVTLLNNGANPTTVVSPSYAFTFSTQVAYGGSYAVTVGTNPTGQNCTVTGGLGANVTANVTGVGIDCSTYTFTIGGTLSGLGNSETVTLLNNGANPTVLSATGLFSLSPAVPYGTNYDVTVGTQPSGQTCTVSNPSGINVTANVSNVNVSCAVTPTYTVSGTITGSGFAMDAGSYFNLYNNGTFLQSYNVDGPYTFASVVSGGSYALTLGPHLYGTYYGVSVACFSAGAATAGSNVTANVTGIVIQCDPY
jgi:hypothetical protein